MLQKMFTTRSRRGGGFRSRARYLGFVFALALLAGCFETEYGPLLAGRPVYNLIHLEESFDTVCAIPSTASIDTSLDTHPEHKRNLLDFSIDDEGREVVRNHAHEAYGLSDFHAERRTDYDDERGEAWLTFIPCRAWFRCRRKGRNSRSATEPGGTVWRTTTSCCSRISWNPSRSP